MTHHRRIELRAFASIALLAALVFAGCDDLRHFGGNWEGSVSGDPSLALGVPAASAMRARVEAVSRSSITMSVHTAPLGSDWLELAPIKRAGADVLGEMQLPGDPLRTYVGVLQPPGAESFFVLVSLYAEDRIEVRLIRGAEDTYAVFSLHRGP